MSLLDILAGAFQGGGQGLQAYGAWSEDQKQKKLKEEELARQIASFEYERDVLNPAKLAQTQAYTDNINTDNQDRETQRAETARIKALAGELFLNEELKGLHQGNAASKFGQIAKRRGIDVNDAASVFSIILNGLPNEPRPVSGGGMGGMDMGDALKNRKEIEDKKANIEALYGKLEAAKSGIVGAADVSMLSPGLQSLMGGASEDAPKEWNLPKDELFKRTYQVKNVIDLKAELDRAIGELKGNDQYSNFMGDGNAMARTEGVRQWILGKQKRKSVAEQSPAGQAAERKLGNTQFGMSGDWETDRQILEKLWLGGR
jgi:hypothetical protein